MLPNVMQLINNENHSDEEKVKMLHSISYFLMRNEETRYILLQGSCNTEQIQTDQSKL